MSIIKRKSVMVILVSVSIIAAVLVMTLASMFFYLVYLQNQESVRTSAKINRINAKFYSKYIKIEDINTRVKLHTASRDIMVRGIIRNKGYKVVSSVTVVMDFLDRSRNPVHSSVFVIKKTVSPDKEAKFIRKTSIRPFRLMNSSLARRLKHNQKWPGSINCRITSIGFF
jgi:hypothetical protein